MQLTYRGTPYPQTPTTVAATPTAIGKYRGAAFPIHTVTTTPASHHRTMTYRGVTYLDATSQTALAIVSEVESLVLPNLAAA